MEGLPVTEENYDSAVEILKTRFGKPQELISAHMKELLKLNIRAVDKPSQPRFLYDKISDNIRGLELWKSSLNSTVVCLFQSLWPNFRTKYKYMWHEIRLKTFGRSTPCSIIFKVKLIRGRWARKLKAQQSKLRVHRPQKPRYWQSERFCCLLNSESTVPKCVYCTERHFSASCCKVTDIKARKDILSRDKRCFMCLKNWNI